MALPANDAFSLGLAHDQHRRSSSRTRTPSLPRRSSSPKVSSPPPAFSPPPSGPVSMAGAPSGKRGHKRKASSRQEQHSVSLSSSSPTTIEELVEEVESHILAREARKAHVRNGSASSASNKKGPGKDKPNDNAAAKIDWEIPRKALHSSIGMCSSSRASIFLRFTLLSSSPTASAVRSNSFTDPGRLFVTFLGFFTVYLWTSNGSREHVVVALSTALAVLIPIDILRLRYPTFERFFEKCVGIFMRDSEKVRIHSTPHPNTHMARFVPRKSPTA